MNRRSFLKRASLAVGAAAISLSMLRAPKHKKLILDEFPGAERAYMLRKQSSTYNGPIATIRRADGKTMDIYNGIDEDVIKWAGSRDVYATLYDQSGNNNAPYKGRILL